MLDVFLRTLPFFAIIGLGYLAGRTRFFSEEATAYLTKFVFFFALSAMLFRFSANLPMGEVFDGRLIAGYLWGTAVVYLIATGVALWRNLDIPTTAVEALRGDRQFRFSWSADVCAAVRGGRDWASGADAGHGPDCVFQPDCHPDQRVT